MASGFDVFKSAMALMDELDVSDYNEYIYRAVNILNALIQEVYPYSDTYIKPTQPHKRSTPEMLDVADITQATADLDLDDYITFTVLPYGLAAHLFIDDNPASAQFFQQRYEELLERLKREGMLAESEDIYDVYSSQTDGSGNGIGFEWTTRW